MRRFIVVAHDAPTTPEFSLDDLPGAAGRLDVLCRCVTAGLLQSHGIRTDSEVVVVIRNELVITFEGASIRRLQPDERSTAARFRSAIDDASKAVGAMAVESSPGVRVSRGDLDTVLAETNGHVVTLEAGGQPLPALAPEAPLTFVLSDHRSFTPADERAISEASDMTVSVGPETIHADHAITVVHNYLDTDGYERY